MRVILDTNILLSGLLSPEGAPGELLAAWERQAFVLLTSADLIAEFRRVANRPYFRAHLRASVIESLASGLRDFSEYWSAPHPGPAAPDPADSFLLALAAEARADFLATGDKDLLRIGKCGSTEVVTARRLLELVENP